MIPDKGTIKQVVSLYKQWYSEQSDKPLPDYIQERWQEDDNSNDISSNFLDEIFGDPAQDFNDIINEVFGVSEQLKNKQL